MKEDYQKTICNLKSENEKSIIKISDKLKSFYTGEIEHQKKLLAD